MSLSTVRRANHALKRMLSLDYVDSGGIHLPPRNMRYCGTDFRNDEVFLRSGRDEARRLLDDFALNRDSGLLEIGCGPGRLPIGILAEFGSIRRFEGVDIDRRSIDWCRRHITRRHPNFRFHHVEARHERYNPDGRPMSEGFRLPFDDASFDIIYLHSVFANMNPEDVSVYCAEFARLLAPGGQVFLTAFVEEDVPDVTINPDDYLLQSKGPLNVARYEKSFLFGIIRKAGLTVSRFVHRGDLGGQSILHLARAN